jgi:hypothetical protein
MSEVPSDDAVERVAKEIRHGDYQAFEKDNFYGDAIDWPLARRIARIAIAALTPTIAAESHDLIAELRALVPFLEANGFNPEVVLLPADHIATLEARLDASEARERELVEGLADLVASWDRNTHEREKFVQSEELGGYWSPHAAMVNSEQIAFARALINKERVAQ